jgi:hypothetical protein
MNSHENVVEFYSDISMSDEYNSTMSVVMMESDETQEITENLLNHTSNKKQKKKKEVVVASTHAIVKKHDANSVKKIPSVILYYPFLCREKRGGTTVGVKPIPFWYQWGVHQVFIPPNKIKTIYTLRGYFCS